MEVLAMSKAGWVKIDRELLDHWSWNGATFSEGQAIIDLHLKASHKARKVRLRCGLVTIQRGQLICSENGLALDWNWSRGKVRRFLALLESAGEIVQQKDRQKTILTLCNYDKNQEVSEQGASENSTTPSIRTRIKEERNNKKKSKKEKGRPELSAADLSPTIHSLASTHGFSKSTWRDLVNHLKAKGAFFVGRVKTVIAEMVKASSQGFSIADCVACMVHHQWKGFKAEWLAACKFFKERMAKKAEEQAMAEVKRTKKLIEDLSNPSPKRQSKRRWLIDETHFLVLERKITRKQRADILSGRLKIDPFVVGCVMV